MNILVVDVQGILSEKQSGYARNRFQFALAKFRHQVNGATLHFSSDDRCENFTCLAHVSVEGSGVLTVKRQAESSYRAMNLAVDAAVQSVGVRLTRKCSFNADSISMSLAAIKKPFHLLFQKAEKSV